MTPAWERRFPYVLAAALLTLSATIGIVLATTQAAKSVVTVANRDPGNVLSGVTLSMEGKSYDLGELKLNQIKQVFIEPSSGSALTLRYLRAGKPEEWKGPTVEASGYRVAVAIQPDGSVKQSSVRWPARPEAL